MTYLQNSPKMIVRIRNFIFQEVLLNSSDEYTSVLNERSFLNFDMKILLCNAVFLYSKNVKNNTFCFISVTVITYQQVAAVSPYLQK